MTAPTRTPFQDALEALGLNGNYPSFFGNTCRSVEDLAKALGSSVNPADWDDYAQLAAALLRDQQDLEARGNLSASDERTLNFYKSERGAAIRQAERLWNQCLRESQAWHDRSLRRPGMTLTRSGEQLERDIREDRGMTWYGAGARIGYEERQYSQSTNVPGARDRAPVSFFADAYRFQFDGDLGARERLERHAEEVRRNGEQTERATSTGSFAGLVIPQYLVDQAALVLRAGRPIRNTLNPLPLPEAGMQFTIPKASTGASVGVQATENTSVSSTDEVWGNLTLNVATIAGQQDVSRQAIERGTQTDTLVFMDLAGAYAGAEDQQIVSGSGANGQVFGILNTSGIGQATAYTAAATLQSFYSKINGSIASIAGTRFLPADHAAMHPRRSGWLRNQFDSAGRPIVVPSSQQPQNAAAVDVATYGSGGSILDLGIVVDANIPAAVGTASEDLVIVYRAADLLLWEDGDGTPKELRFEQTLGQQLTVKLVAYSYMAFTAARYPQSVAVIGGNAASAGQGQIQPTF